MVARAAVFRDLMSTKTDLGSMGQAAGVTANFTSLLLIPKGLLRSLIHVFCFTSKGQFQTPGWLYFQR